MIGNDIVDLHLAQKESNWKRRGFLDKIFSSEEQKMILSSENQELMVWNLWSRKEACYKIYNRQTGIRGFFPLRLECNYNDKNTGTVSVDKYVYFTQTEISNNYIYTVAVSEKKYFKQIKNLNSTAFVKKEHGIPYLLDPNSKLILPVSITHHGRFQKIISIV